MCQFKVFQWQYCSGMVRGNVQNGKSLTLEASNKKNLHKHLIKNYKIIRICCQIVNINILVTL